MAEEFNRMTINYNRKPCYDIVFSDSFDALGIELDALELLNKNVCIVTDSNVNSLLGSEVKEIVSKHCKEVFLYEFPAGEENKTLDNISKMYEFFIENKLTRNDILIALGGGVVGDMTGFAAATYLRGIDFIQIPTTLLAQVDSSIGGKTGVDFARYKNMVGAFHMPKLVYSNVNALKTLDDRQFAAGFAEVMKHGIIKDKAFYGWLIDHIYEINDRENETLTEMIYKSCVIKKNVVEKDPTEKGERALLNFGHTIGHGIEKASNFTLFHGECVALGCVAAALISKKHGLIDTDECYEIRDMFVPFHLPITLTDMDPMEVLKNTKSDKKNETGTLKFILLSKLGKAVVDTTVTDDDIIEAVKELIYE